MAMGFFKKLFGSGSAAPEAYFRRGVAHIEKGDCDAAIADFTKAIGFDPQHEHAWCNRGLAHLVKGDYKEALSDYNQALRLDPRDAIVLTYRFMAAIGARLKTQGGLPQAPRIGTVPDPPRPIPPRSDPNEDGEQPPSPPSACRVAARAIVLAAVVYRSGLEEHAHNPDAEQFRRHVLGWTEAVGLSSEVEQSEREYLQTPVGQADSQTKINGFWRGEGLAVLAWALKGCELPPYDQYVDLLTAADNVGFVHTDVAKRFLESASLRPSPEIDRLAAHLTIVHWRLRQFGLTPGPMDFQGYLRQHPGYREAWLDGLQFVEGDLAIGDVGVAAVARDRLESCQSTAMERQIAAYWLQGDNETYSDVGAPTLLMGL